jgi:hypothetical protein
MVAVSKDSGITPLGYVVWFSVPDEDVPLRKLRSTWGIAGLEMDCVPTDQKAVNAFKRAVRDQEKRVVNEADGTVTETDVRDVLENSDEVIYQVSRVVRDLHERVVQYPKALRVYFNKETLDIQMRPLGDLPRRDVLPIMEEIQDAYDANAKTVTGAKVRSLVRSYLRSDRDEGARQYGLSGENLRGKAGGVYFVLARFASELERLGEFLDNVYPDHRAYLYTVPMADGASEREMIRRAHAQNAVAEMEAAMAEAAALIRGDRERAVRENVLKHHWGRLEQAKRRAAMYADALKEEQESVTTHLDLLNRQLRKLTSM